MKWKVDVLIGSDLFWSDLLIRWPMRHRKNTGTCLLRCMFNFGRCLTPQGHPIATNLIYLFVNFTFGSGGLWNIWKTFVITLLKVLSKHLPGETEGSHGHFRIGGFRGRESNREPAEHERLDQVVRVVARCLCYVRCFSKGRDKEANLALCQLWKPAGAVKLYHCSS